MKSARSTIPAILLLALVACGCEDGPGGAATSADPALVQQAAEAARTAVRFLRDSVAEEGGYLWAYSGDLSLREGEFHPALGTQRPPATTIWVQPPGTPSVGMAMLDLWEATGDTFFLDGAKAAATALVRGQLVSGGWAYQIDFSPADRSRWAYRTDLGDAAPPEGARNVSTLDDRTTQAALRLLMRVDAATSDSAIHEATEYGLLAFVRAQYQNGAWPQRYTSEGPGSGGYSGFYTFNDATINTCIDLMLEAWRLLGDERWLASAVKGGDFIIASQLPAPQQGWAQQYDEDMQPAHARSFEPRAVCASVTRRNIRTLVDLYLATGEERFLAPIPPALDWLERSVIPIPRAYFEARNRPVADSGWARLYEIGTNTPIFGDRDGLVHYTWAELSEERRLGYGWYSVWQDGAARLYAEVQEKGRDAMLAERQAREAPSGGALAQEITGLEPRVRSTVQALGTDGRWLDDEGWIRMRDYNRNFRTLARYLALANGRAERSAR